MNSPRYPAMDNAQRKELDDLISIKMSSIRLLILKVAKNCLIRIGRWAEKALKRNPLIS